MSKPGGDPSSGISLGDVLRRPKRHPACRRREAQPGSCTERENLIGDAKGKGASGANREAESTDAPGRGGLLRSSDESGVMPVERREQAIAIWLGSTGNGRNPMFNGRRQPSCGGTSRMTRECQVRICERLGVKFPGPTRRLRPRHHHHRRWGLAAASCCPCPNIALVKGDDFDPVATPGNATSRDCGTSVFECWRRRSNHERHGGKYQAVVRGDRCGVQESYRVFFATKACCVGYSG